MTYRLIMAIYTVTFTVDGTGYLERLSERINDSSGNEPLEIRAPPFITPRNKGVYLLVKKAQSLFI